MNTQLEFNLKDVDVKVDHEYIYINIAHNMFTATISINDLKSFTSKLVKVLQTK